MPVPSAQARRGAWLRLLLGVAALAVGVAALVWPEATVAVVVVVVFGVLTCIVGIICLRDVVRSALLLVLIVGIGWLLEGLSEVALGIADAPDGPGRRARLAAGEPASH